MLKFLNAQSDLVRSETFQGKEYTVIPVVALVEGVLQAANSPQPELVKADELDPASWNGRPITFDHPVLNGQLVSVAETPETFEEWAVGTIFNSQIVDGNKLRVEAWIDNSKIAALGEDAVKAFAAMKEGEVVEVSTGYFAESEPESGTFNGEHFEAIQNDLKPDHLAILTGGEAGACSIADGCGAPRVNSLKSVDNSGTTPFTILGVDGTIQWLRSNAHSTDYKASDIPGLLAADPAEAAKRAEKEKLEENSKHIKKEKDKEKNKQNSLSSLLENSRNLFIFKDAEEISDMDVRRALSSALETNGENFWGVVAVFANSFVFERGFDTLVRKDFSINSEGVVTLGKEETIVRPITEFIPVVTNEENSNAEQKMNREEKIKDLIGNNASPYQEEHKGFLESLSDEQLEAVPMLEAAKEIKKEDEKEGEAGKEVEAAAQQQEPEKKEEPVTVEGYIAEAPPEIREVLNQGISMQQNKRDHLVKGIMANKSNAFSEPELQAFGMPQLEKLAELAVVPDYSMRGGPVTNAAQDESIIPPTRDPWAKAEKAS